MSAEKCCVCSSVDVVYRNYLDLPFCDPCANGKGANAPRPELKQASNELTELRARVAELEQRQIQRPSRFSATPAEIDQYLRRILAEDTLLNYQRAIGNKAVEEAAVDIRMEIATLRVNGVLEPGKDWAASAAADHIDPAKGGGHYPARLLCSQHNGFGRCPGAPWCTPNELHDSPSVPQQRGEAR